MKFRTMSVATSTVNRILNIADGLRAEVPAPRTAPAVPLPDGGSIDIATAAPTPPVGADDPALVQAVVADGLGL